MDYEKCNLCHRHCGVDRTKSVGYCGMPAEPYVSRAALHKWEEPIISGTRGSGTIFFSGCSLGCVFCQNRDISRGVCGERVDARALTDIMLRLQHDGAHNVNFVTPTHYIPTVAEAIIGAKREGLTIPIVYNTGSYDTPEALCILEGLVDVYLPDFKYYTEKSAGEYAGAPDYPMAARAAISEMLRQVGPAKLSDDGLIERGVVARILLLPAHVAEAKLSLKYLYSTYGDSIFISLMSQYTPLFGMNPPLDRRVAREEYRQLTDYADRLGVKNCFVQEISSAREEFIPSFDGEGVKT